MFKIISFCFVLLLSNFAYGQTIDSIQIGSGGGFTGEITAYKIIKEKITKGKGLGALRYSESAVLSNKKLKKIKKGANEILKKNTTFNTPYTTYKFINVYTNGKKIELVWGDPAFKCPKEIQDYYTKVNKIIAKLKFKTI